MKTGIQLIQEERVDQMYKHGISMNDDFQRNNEGQLRMATSVLIMKGPFVTFVYQHPPKGWNIHIWKRLLEKPYKERLSIAGALIAAEIDRLQMHEQLTKISSK